MIVITLREVIVVFLSRISKRQEVVAFLDELKAFLEGSDFDIDHDLILIKKKKADDEEHSTPYTLLDLDYDSEDVVNRLKELTVAEYSETKIDKDDFNPPLLFVFGKDINRRLVYVKLKIKKKEDLRKHILCVSFHYAKEKMKFPYA
ncbi:hypothetical protein [Oribacterium parvum]|uniref:hypothetical protein n=1 Tax=Oribacterium parvum TaxID=1501329 RepID=UPI0028DB4F60|nr:hypothetical protein [Oribacterium parvum]